METRARQSKTLACRWWRVWAILAAALVLAIAAAQAQDIRGEIGELQEELLKAKRRALVAEQRAEAAEQKVEEVAIQLRRAEAKIEAATADIAGLVVWANKVALLIADIDQAGYATVGGFAEYRQRQDGERARQAKQAELDRLVRPIVEAEVNAARNRQEEPIEPNPASVSMRRLPGGRVAAVIGGRYHEFASEAAAQAFIAKGRK